jgi:hypothetical protein
MFISIDCSLNVVHKLQFIIDVFAHHRLIQFDLKIAISMNRLVSQFIVPLLVGIIVMSMLTWSSHISPVIAVLQSMILCNRWHIYYSHECATVMKEKQTVQVYSVQHKLVLLLVWNNCSYNNLGRIVVRKRFSAAVLTASGRHANDASTEHG